MLGGQDTPAECSLATFGAVESLAYVGVVKLSFDKNSTLHVMVTLTTLSNHGQT